VGERGRNQFPEKEFPIIGKHIVKYQRSGSIYHRKHTA
jgi:hypothetical protein